MHPIHLGIRAPLKVNLVLPLLFLGIAGHASILMAESIGTFSAIGNMSTARLWHTATLLTNGKVLIAGGLTQGAALLSQASAELYDPSSGTFSKVFEMTAARALHSATLLPNGNVLIAGGFGSGGASLAGAELYDPTTETFIATGEMTIPRAGHTATLLGNGKVLIIGGADNAGSVFASAELYDPSTGIFTATGNMSTGRANHTATLLPNGKVLVEGFFHSAEVYDPDTDAFGPATPSVYEGTSVTATLLPNGKVLLTLHDGELPTRAVELYDPEAGSFTATSPMNAPRFGETATLLPDGKVLIAGGGDVPDGDLLYAPWRTNGAEVYDPATGEFSLTGHMTAGRNGHTATLLTDGTVLIAGGQGPNPNLSGNAFEILKLDTAEMYRPSIVLPAAALVLTGR